MRGASQRRPKPMAESVPLVTTPFSGEQVLSSFMALGLPSDHKSNGQSIDSHQEVCADVVEKVKDAAPENEAVAPGAKGKRRNGAQNKERSKAEKNGGSTREPA